jgi:hypothetical protein
MTEETLPTGADEQTAPGRVFVKPKSADSRCCHHRDTAWPFRRFIENDDNPGPAAA